MTMKTAVLTRVLTFTLLIQFSACWAAEGQVDKTAVFISKAAQEIGGAKKIGTNATPNWSENPEVKEVTAFGANKRIGTIMAIIDYLTANEDKIFPNIKTNSNQVAAAIITRLFSLTHLSTLMITSTDNDVVVKDYLDGEIADLKMVLSRKISYGIYLRSRKMRDDKRTMLLYQDAMIVTEIGTLKMREDNIAHVLANKTTLISLLEACYSNNDLCAKI